MTESRTPAHTLDEIKDSTTSQNPTIASPKETERPFAAGLSSLLGSALSGRPPVIASPKEPGSLGEGSVGVAAGDPAGGANVVAAATSAGKGIMATVKVRGV